MYHTFTLLNQVTLVTLHLTVYLKQVHY